jgi:hypothetical protein
MQRERQIEGEGKERNKSACGVIRRGEDSEILKRRGEAT